MANWRVRRICERGRSPSAFATVQSDSQISPFAQHIVLEMSYALKPVDVGSNGGASASGNDCVSSDTHSTGTETEAAGPRPRKSLRLVLKSKG